MKVYYRKREWRYLTVLCCLLLIFGSVFGTIEKKTDTMVTYASEDGVSDFVSRLYTEILERTPDEDGLAEWSAYLKNRTFTGAQVASGFIMSEEFMNKEMTNTTFVQLLYRAFFGREADTNGLNAWVDFLDEGYRKSYVFAGFANSDEFLALCEGYGVERGSVPVTVSEMQPGLSEKEYHTWCFVERLYTEILKRTPDIQGIREWANYLQEGTYSGAEVASGFILSNEFLTKHMTNEEYVQILYRAFFGRQADPAGLEAWVNVLETGSAKEYVFAGFANSNEFGVLCDSYGIIQGNVEIPNSNPAPDDEMKGIRFEFLFDEKGQLTGENYYQEDGTLLGNARMWYDEDGSLEKVRAYDSKNELLWSVRYTRTNGELWEIIYTAENAELYYAEPALPELNSEEEYLFRYVEHGNEYCLSFYKGNLWSAELSVLGGNKLECTYYTYYDGILEYYQTVTYDEAGNELSVTKYDAQGTVVFQTLKSYNEDGKITEQVSYDELGNINLHSYYTYADGHLEKVVRYGEGNLLECIEVYNEKEEIIQNTYYYYDYSTGEFSGHHVSNYTDYVVTEELWYDKYGVMTHHFLYYLNGKTKQVSSYNSDGTISSVYNYSEDEKMTEKEQYWYENSELIRYIISEYNVQELLEKETWYNGLNEITMYTLNEYDEEFRETSSLSYNKDGKLLNGYTISYDDAGEVEEEITYSNGVRYSWKYYEHEEDGSKRLINIWYEKDGVCISQRWTSFYDTEGNFVETKKEDVQWNLVAYGMRTGNYVGLTQENTILAKKAHQIYVTVVKEDMTDFEKLLALHDYIVLHTNYDYGNYLADTIPTSSYGLTGVLLYGTAVCNGYAVTLQMFLDAAEIENKLVTGTANNGSSEEGHAWNLVQLDGEWYHVDSTWDDSSRLLSSGAISNPYGMKYNYFCISDSTMSTNHFWNEGDYPSTAVSDYSGSLVHTAYRYDEAFNPVYQVTFNERGAVISKGELER